MNKVLLLPLFAAALIGCAPNPTKSFAAETPKPLNSFESEADIKDARLNHASAVLTAQGATEGKSALQVTFQPPATYPSYSFPIPTPWDWSGFGGLAFDVTNPGAEPISFSLRIDSAQGSDGSKNSRTNSGRVEAGKTVTYLMPFNVEQESPDMSKLPGYTVMRETTGKWNPFNLKNIAVMQIFTVKPPTDRVLIFDNLRLVPALPPIPPPPLKTDTKPILSFETDAEIQSVKTNNASTTVVTQGATEGKSALRMKFEPTSQYPNVGFKLDALTDMRGYGGLAFDLTNPTDTAVRFGVRMDSSASAGGTGAGARQGGGTVDAGQSASFIMPFGIDASALGMKSLPGFGNFRSTGSGGSGVFDLRKIAEWQIFMVRPSSTSELIIDNARLVPGQKQDFNNIIDQYGQYTRADWPGKIKSDADFAAQLKAEDADLKANPTISGFDKYGGWATGPQLKATGFFRVEKYNGKWSFVDPDGRLFLSFGPTTVGPNQSTPISGREYMFAALPKSDALLAKFASEKGDLDFLGANLERKYGADYKKPFFDRTYDRLRSWGFNTIGAFSSWDTLKNGKVPYTATVWAMSGHTRTPLGNDLSHTQADPFDPRFATTVANSVKGQAARMKDDPYFLGYFVGNEENWGHWKNGPRSQYGLVLGALKMKAEVSPAKRAFIAQLQAKYPDVAKLNAVWKTNFADWNAMNEPVEIKDPLAPEIIVDLSPLLKSYAAQYFKVVSEEIKKADPNHLYLGCRFAGYSPEVVEGAAQYSDVLSFNVYTTRIDPKGWTILDTIDKPVIIGEFHFGATDRGMFNTGLVGVADQKARGTAYQNYVRSVVDHPKFIGAHWFQYTDQPTTGRGDGENGNVGLVSITDTPFPELIAGGRAAHSEMYTRRFGK
jgi:hypothetical protein